jgi:hypothetical protein
MSDRNFYLGIAVLVTTAWMFRWQVIPSSATETVASMVHFKLDRFTGISYVCRAEFCSKASLDD